MVIYMVNEKNDSNIANEISNAPENRTIGYNRDFLPWKKIGGETMNSCFHSNKNMLLVHVNVFK